MFLFLQMPDKLLEHCRILDQPENLNNGLGISKRIEHIMQVNVWCGARVRNMEFNPCGFANM